MAPLVATAMLDGISDLSLWQKSGSTTGGAARSASAVPSRKRARRPGSAGMAALSKTVRPLAACLAGSWASTRRPMISTFMGPPWTCSMAFMLAGPPGPVVREDSDDRPSCGGDQVADPAQIRIWSERPGHDNQAEGACGRLFFEIRELNDVQTRMRGRWCEHGAWRQNLHRSLPNLHRSLPNRCAGGG